MKMIKLGGRMDKPAEEMLDELEALSDKYDQTRISLGKLEVETSAKRRELQDLGQKVSLAREKALKLTSGADSLERLGIERLCSLLTPHQRV